MKRRINDKRKVNEISVATCCWQLVWTLTTELNYSNYSSNTLIALSVIISTDQGAQTTCTRQMRKIMKNFNHPYTSQFSFQMNPLHFTTQYKSHYREIHSHYSPAGRVAGRMHKFQKFFQAPRKARSSREISRPNRTTNVGFSVADGIPGDPRAFIYLFFSLWKCGSFSSGLRIAVYFNFIKCGSILWANF